MLPQSNVGSKTVLVLVKTSSWTAGQTCRQKGGHRFSLIYFTGFKSVPPQIRDRAAKIIKKKKKTPTNSMLAQDDECSSNDFLFHFLKYLIRLRWAITARYYLLSNLHSSCLKQIIITNYSLFCFSSTSVNSSFSYALLLRVSCLWFRNHTRLHVIVLVIYLLDTNKI